MCGIFGYINYGNTVKDKDLKNLLKSLACESAVRGIDATGIAYVNLRDNIEISKAPKAAYSFKMKFGDIMPKAVMGHTRHTTQGSEKLNINNHPFKGKAGKQNFALAHNGILYNERLIRKSYGLPETNIQTDSYIAVQLLEKEKALNMRTLKEMAEITQGSFCFTLLDDGNNLYIVKGDNPVSVIHNKRLKFFIYASTDQILASALIRSELYSSFLPTKRNAGDIEYINLSDGEILKIDDKGKLAKCTFRQNEWGCMFYDWPLPSGTGKFHRAVDGLFNPAEAAKNILADTKYEVNEFNYIEGLKSVAKSMGCGGEMIDCLVSEGWPLEEIEEYLYHGGCF